MMHLEDFSYPIPSHMHSVEALHKSGLGGMMKAAHALGGTHLVHHVNSAS